VRNTSFLNDLLSRVAEMGLGVLRAEGAERSLGDDCAALLRGGGEASQLALARAVLDRFAGLSAEDRHAFFAEMKMRFGVDAAATEAALARWRETGDEDDARAVHFASEPATQDLIRRLNRAPGGTGDVVRMREALRAGLAKDPGLASLDRDFLHLLRSWFSRGFLELRRIDWSTSAAVLEKIIAYEAVHAIRDWDDLRRRVAAPDRRLYAFFHPAMRDEPLIFVEVALTGDMPAAIGPILAEARTPLDPAKASVAVFYSISNCQKGLAGVSFGSFLIKQVVEDLSRDFPALARFVTLSPVPGLREWALAEARRGADGMLSEAERRALARLDPADGSGDAAEAVAAVDALAGIAARYLIEAKSPRGDPLDPVARFHLGNGARLERINTGADHSARGLAHAWGVMVNYVYDLDMIERNHEAFAETGTVAAAPALRRLLKSR